jgi:hypothetical protein
MTNLRPPRPEPSTGTNYDTFLIPRSKTPEKNGIYDLLLELGWRFEPAYALWYTPESETYEAAGRLEYAPDYSWATIQPPNRPGSMDREEPLIRLIRTAWGWMVYKGTEEWS